MIPYIFAIFALICFSYPNIPGMYAKFFKRAGDIFAAVMILTLFSPIILLITLILSIVNHGRPIFLQERPGKNGEIFTIIKFKTMNDNTDEQGNLLHPDERITPVGRFIRNFSLDELLQLVNVLKGDMSIVGPRPLRVEYLKYYSATQARRHEVKPGITGWAQVNGRNALTWKQRFELDVWYVDNLSFLLDLKILLKTIAKVLKSENVDVPLTGFRGDTED